MNKTKYSEPELLREVVAKGALEPTLRDLYVEGEYDVSFYKWFLNQCGSRDVSVAKISNVVIKSDVLMSYGLDDGERGRIIALALELDKAYPSMLPSVRCIADSDFDFLLHTGPMSNHLLYTDYTCVEMYSFNDKTVEKALMLGFGVTQINVPVLIRSMVPVLSQLFLVRATNQWLRWRMSMIPVENYVEFDGERIQFNRELFVHNYLLSSGKIKMIEIFEENLEQMQSKGVDDDRKIIHRDDYVTLLSVMVNT